MWVAAREARGTITAAHLNVRIGWTLDFSGKRRDHDDLGAHTKGTQVPVQIAAIPPVVPGV